MQTRKILGGTALVALVLAVASPAFARGDGGFGGFHGGFHGEFHNGFRRDFRERFFARPRFFGYWNAYPYSVYPYRYAYPYPPPYGYP
jgi:hypothetical protein